jgi:hypothetical protein
MGVARILMNFEPLYLRQFLIIEEYRRRYYGEQAFQMLLSYLKTDSVDIEVLSNNYQGVRFWEKMGFVEGINICDIKIRRNKMQEFNLGIYRANANAKLLSFFEYLYIKLGLKEDEKFVKEYFEIVNENDLIESLNYYIVKNHVTAQITADNYISSITTFYEELYEKYGVTNEIFLNLEMKKRLLKRTKGIITSLRKTESKDVASDEQYETLRVGLRDIMSHFEYEDIRQELADYNDKLIKNTEQYYSLLSAITVNIVLENAINQISIVRLMLFLWMTWLMESGKY